MKEGLKGLIDFLQSDSFVNRVSQTGIYNEGWMLRLVMNELEQEDGIDSIGNIHFEDFNKDKGIRWFSEALLPTPFPARSKDENGNGVRIGKGENHTHADAIAGYYCFNNEVYDSDSKPPKWQETELKKIGARFYIIEAKMKSGLSQGVTNTSGQNYNQITRSIACIGKLIEISEINLEDIHEGEMGFCLLCPKENIISITKGKGNFLFKAEAEVIEKDNNKILEIKKIIKDQIKERIDNYKEQESGDKEDIAAGQCGWIEENFSGLVDKIDLKVITWDTLFEKIADEGSKQKLKDFYERCKEYNRI